MSVKWQKVANRLQQIVYAEERLEPDERSLNARQCASLRWAAGRLPLGGFVLADEVGLGKTRVACAVARAVLDCGGRAAAIVPRGLIPQWEREWEAVVREDAEYPVKTITTFNNFVTEIARGDRRRRRRHRNDAQPLEQRIEDGFPKPDQPELWLISHGLSTPQIRFRDEGFKRAPWSIALPSLVRSRVHEHAENHDGRTRAGRLNRIEDALGDTMTSDNWRIIRKMAEQAANSVRSDGDLIEKLEEMCWIDPRSGKDNADYAAQFKQGGSGITVFRRLLAHWFGEFDFVIIDEAHKSRGEEADLAQEDPETRKVETDLSRLLASIRMARDARRLGLTATPLELGAHQWDDLLKRALRGPSGFAPEIEAARISALAGEFDRATAAARRYLESTLGRELLTPMVDGVCDASRGMSVGLSPVLTRRRRSREAMYREFRSALVEQDHERKEWSRPHRNISLVHIKTQDLDPGSTQGRYAKAWTRAFFAMECLSAALGKFKQPGDDEDVVLTRLRKKYQVAYTRLSAGHLGDSSQEELAELRDEALQLATEEPPVSRRAQRIAYWVQQEIDALNEIAGATEAVDPLTEHPRILAAVEAIERFTSPADAAHEPEKVLVFGTFVAPMRVLAKVLEARHALRMIAQGRPVPVDLGPVIQAELVHRQALRMKEDLSRYAPKWLGNRAALEEAWHQAKDQYTELRDDAKSQLDRMVHSFLVDVGGIEPDHPDCKRVIGRMSQIARDYTIDRLLYGYDQRWSSKTRLDLDTAQKLFEEFWREEIEPALAQAREKDDERSWTQRLGDILDLLEDDGGHDTHHVRLLHGATKYTTRQSVQARFNRPLAAPHVLVAQSRVGREGLDFHRACRAIVQFNAEWNPGVLEQQIGRVDRIDSRWETLAKNWVSTGPSRQAKPPFIEVIRLVLPGTYDAFQWDLVHARAHLFDATLYGELLPSGLVANQPEHVRRRLAEAAPDFEPNSDVTP